MRRSIADRLQGVDALAQPGAQGRVIKVRLSLFKAFDRVMPRGRTEPEAVVLREHIPHSMRSLSARGDLGEGRSVVPFLRVDEAL